MSMEIVEQSNINTNTNTNATYENVYNDNDQIDDTNKLLHSDLCCYISTSGYLFIALYKILFDRLVKAKRLCEDASQYTIADMRAHPTTYYKGKDQ